MAEKIFIGTAHWQIPKEFSESFPLEGSHLERYANALNGVEINSSFYKEHKAITYKRWAETVPKDFRFSFKLSKVFTHEMDLKVSANELKNFLTGPLELGSHLGPLLVQLPPGLAFNAKDSAKFFENLRSVYPYPIVFEPRHKSWTFADALQLQREFRLSKVFADPSPCPLPVGEMPLTEVIYFRLHGSPKIYKSDYSRDYLQRMSENIRQWQHLGKEVWCIFDNTTYGFATKNALELTSLLNSPQTVSKRPLSDEGPDHYL